MEVDHVEGNRYLTRIEDRFLFSSDLSVVINSTSVWGRCVTHQLRMEQVHFPAG